MSSPAAKSPYAGHRFPPEVISQAVWLYFRFPLSLRMVEEMLAARGITVTHETVRQWALKFGQEFANRIRRRLPCAGDKWHRDRPEPGGPYAAVRSGRRAHCSAAAWSSARVSFATAVRTFSMQWAPRGVQRICWLAPIRRCSSHCTVLSVVAVEIGSSLRRAVA